MFDFTIDLNVILLGIGMAGAAVAGIITYVWHQGTKLDKNVAAMDAVQTAVAESIPKLIKDEVDKADREHSAIRALIEKNAEHQRETDKELYKRLGHLETSIAAIGAKIDVLHP